MRSKEWSFEYSDLDDAMAKLTSFDAIQEYSRRHKKTYDADLLVGTDIYIVKVIIND